MKTPDPGFEPGRLGPRALWQRVRQMAITADSPRRVAAAFAFGVFLSFSPFLGLQLILGLGIATVLRLSRLAVFIGLWANLPWFMLPWYTLTTLTGAFLLRVPLPAEIGAELSAVMAHPFYRAAFWEQLAAFAGPFLWAFFLGSTLGAAVVGLATYAFLAATLRAADPADGRDSLEAPDSPDSVDLTDSTDPRDSTIRD